MKKCKKCEDRQQQGARMIALLMYVIYLTAGLWSLGFGFINTEPAPLLAGGIVTFIAISEYVQSWGREQ